MAGCYEAAYDCQDEGAASIFYISSVEVQNSLVCLFKCSVSITLPSRGPGRASLVSQSSSGSL
jgi:hypothetical protein